MKITNTIVNSIDLYNKHFYKRYTKNVFLKLLLALLFIVTINTRVFSQNNNNYNTFIMFDAGKSFSNYHYYKYYDGLENVKLSMSYKIVNRLGISLSQSYSRNFNKKTNNRAIVLNTSINFFIIPYTQKNVDIKISIGNGFLQIYHKCLYEIYPFKENFTGNSFNANATILYHLNSKFSVNVNYDMIYSFLYFNNNTYMFNDAYYYKTAFSSVNIGLCYSFNIANKKPSK